MVQAPAPPPVPPPAPSTAPPLASGLRPPAHPVTRPAADTRGFPWGWLLVLPLFFVGPGLLPGQRFLPQHPASFAPLSIEDPVLAETAARGANILASDRLSPILTDWLAARKSARAGVAPLWDPAAGLGAPLAAGSVAGLLYPPNLINLVLPPEFAGAWAAMLALFLAGLGMALFLGRVGLGGGPALVGAIAIQAGAFAIANLHYGVKVDAALYLPWSLWAAEGLARRRPGAGALLFLFTALSFLAGFPPIALFAASAVLLHAGGQALAGARWRAAFRRTGASPARPPLAATRADSGWGAPALVRVCAWLFLGLAGAAVQLIPTAELSLLSTRQGRTPADLQAESLPPATLAGLPVANLFGSPQLAVPPAVLPAVLPAVFPAPQPPQRGGAPTQLPTIDPVVVWATPPGRIESARRANPIEWNLYTGPIILILALAGLLAGPRRAAPALLLLLASIGFAQGWPGLRLFYHLPGFNAGAPARALSVAWVAWPWLAALGAQALSVTHGRALKGALALAVALLVAGLALGQRIDKAANAGAVGTASTAIAANTAGTGSADSPGGLFNAAWVSATAITHGTSAAEVQAVTALPDSAPAITARLADSAQRLTLLSAGGVLACALGLLLALRTRRRLLPCVPWLLLLGTDGLLSAREHLAPRPLGGPVFPDSGLMAAIESTAAGGRVLRLDESASGIGDVLELARPNLATAWGAKELLPYAVFPNRRLVEVMTAIDPRSAYRGGASRISTPTVIAHPALDLFHVTCLLSTRALEHPRLKLVLARERFFIYRRLPPADLDSLESAWLVPRAQGAASAVALGLVTSGQLSQLADYCVVPPQATARATARAELPAETPAESSAASQVESSVESPAKPPARAPAQPGTPPPPSSETPWRAGGLEFERPAPDRMDFKLSAGDGGWLVVSEAWYPGWKATVNGEDVAVSPANHALMALPVPSGEAVVRLFYEPTSVRVGALLSALATLFALGHLVHRRRRRPAAPRP